MRLIVTSEERFGRSPDGSFWTRGGCSYRFWTRYLEAFDEVTVVSRITDCDIASEEWRRSDGPGVRFWPLPYYLGPSGFLRKYHELRKAIAQSLRSHDALLFRSPSPIAAVAQRYVRPGRPYAVEIVGDPYDAFAPRALEHPARPLVRWFMTRHLVRQCRSASAVAYVTNGILQQRYRAAPNAFTTSYSSIDLDEDAFVDRPRKLAARDCYRLISVGSMDAQYKGFDTLIDALNLLRTRGIAVGLTLIGDGRFKTRYQDHAACRGVGGFVTFRGHVPAGNAVRRELDEADVFVLASKSEGLPRAMIEAMARGLPCIGTRVGGVPELLAADCLVARNDSAGLAGSILRLLQNPDLYFATSLQNLCRARQYRVAVLGARRRELYSCLRAQTDEWVCSGARNCDGGVRPATIFGDPEVRFTRSTPPSALSAGRSLKTTEVDHAIRKH